MDHATTAFTLRLIATQIRMLSVAAAHSQLDMAVLKQTRYGAKPKQDDWPLGRLDELAAQLAEPGLTALHKIEQLLGVG